MARYIEVAIELPVVYDKKISALGEAGLFYFQIGDYYRALNFYEKSIKIIDSLTRSNIAITRSDSLTYLGTLLNITDVYLKTKEYIKANKNYNFCRKLGRQIGDNNIIYFCDYGLAKSYFEQNQIDSAIVKFKTALELVKQQSANEYASETANLLAECYLKKGDLAQAMAYNGVSRKLAESRQYTKQLALCDITEGKINTQQKKYVPAVALFKKGLAIATEARDLEIQKSAWEALSDAYTGLDKPALALEAFKNFITLKDSLFSIEKSNELVRMDLEATYSRKQLEDSISHEHKAAAIRLELQKQRVVTYTGFAGIVLVGVLAFFIYRNYNTQKKYNSLLNKEKERHLAHIEAQSHVLSDIAFTQAHEIRGPIATLLGLTQILNTDDPADPENKQILDGIVSVTERLDKTVQEVIGKENQVSAAGKDIGKKS